MNKNEMVLNQVGESVKNQAKVFGANHEIMMACFKQMVINNPKILNCSPRSLADLVIQVAKVKLLPDGRDSVIVPFKNEAQLIVTASGYQKLASRQRLTINSDIVYEKDEFKITSSLEGKNFSHSPAITGDRGNVIGVWALLSGGDRPPKFEYMSEQQVLDRRPKKGDKFSPWDGKHYLEMYKKTAIRSVLKGTGIDDFEQIISVEDAPYYREQEREEQLEQLHGDVIDATEVEEDKEPNMDIGSLM